METSIENLNGDFKTLKHNPKFIQSLINRYVRVDVLKDIVYCGYLDAADPQQFSVFLSVLRDADFIKVLIPGHAILNITQLETEPDLKPVKLCSVDSNKNSAEIKEKLLCWLKKNLLPVSEFGDNIALGNALILPPYSIKDICTDNPMEASQLKNIIMKMPK